MVMTMNDANISIEARKIKNFAKLCSYDGFDLNLTSEQESVVAEYLTSNDFEKNMGRASGKTTVASIILLNEALNSKKSIGVVSPNFTCSRMVLDAIERLYRNLSKILENNGIGFLPTMDVTQGSIDFSNGSRIRVANKSYCFRGVSLDVVYYEEYSRIDPQLIYDITPSLTRTSKRFALGTK